MKLKIGKYVWSYEEVDSIGDTTHLGISKYPDLAIKIKKGMLPMPKRVTTLHEIIHSLYESVGYRFETCRDCENSIDILSNALIAFFDDNKEFVKKKLINSK